MIPRMTDHGAEIGLLAVIAVGVMVLAGMSIAASKVPDAAAWTTILMAIVAAIKERWQQRSIDRMGQSLANAPPSDPPAAGPDQVAAK